MDRWTYGLDPFGGYLSIIVGWIIGLAVIVGLFLLFRNVVCWYWKINRIVNLMEEQNRLLERLVDQKTPGGTPVGMNNGTGAAQ